MKNKKTAYTRIQDRFQYHLEDCECKHCLYWKGKKRGLAGRDASCSPMRPGCSLTACCCEDIKNDALANGRIERQKG